MWPRKKRAEFKIMAEKHSYGGWRCRLDHIGEDTGLRSAWIMLCCRDAKFGTGILPTFGLGGSSFRYTTTHETKEEAVAEAHLIINETKDFHELLTPDISEGA